MRSSRRNPSARLGARDLRYLPGGSVMAVHVRIPTPLRRFTAGAEEVGAAGATVGAVVNDLERQFGGIKERLCDEEGRVRRFVNIYLNGDDIRFLSNLETAVKDGDELSIVPAIAGG
jgi:molybdopterin synthase sulfur carrier subunit